MTSRKIAEYLLKIKAVKISPEAPFTWASGWKSPIYCDNRKTLSFPEVRAAICAGFMELIRSNFPDAEGIAGVATGAIAHGVLVAEAMGLPFIYIRDKAKGHGLQNQLEGDHTVAHRYVVIEDLVSTGGSSTRAVRALQQAGAEVLATFSIFSYGFPQAQEAFAQTGTSYQSLTDMATLLQAAIDFEYLDANQQAVIMAWQKAPQDWQGVEIN